MSELNQYALSQSFGSKMRPIRNTGFGGFALLPTVAESLRARELSNDAVETGQSAFTYDHDRVIAKAFEDVREGASPDALLWDRTLGKKFARQCHQLGVAGSAAELNRRVINIRKNKGRYAKHGIVLGPTTKKDPHTSIVHQYAHVIEFALVKLRYRYGYSIDDILIDPELSKEYEDLALAIAPSLRRIDLRLGALCIRKSRFIRKDEKEEVLAMDLLPMEQALSQPISLARIDVAKIADQEGIIEVSEPGRVLYVARNDDVHAAVTEMKRGDAFQIMDSMFWKPDLDAIQVQYALGSKIDGVSICKWESKLIFEKAPVFNWPLNRAA